MRAIVAEASAMQIPPDPDSFLEMQSTVFGDEVTNNERKNGPTNTMTFIVENAPLFRYFAEHLPNELSEDWKKALGDKHSLERIEAEYAKFRDAVEKTLGDMDPELFDEFIAATERADVDEASRILETHFQQQNRTEE